MANDNLREEIVFIRQAIEEGRSYARFRGLDLMVWGIAISLGYVGTYSYVVGWSHVVPGWIWLVCVLAAWVYSLRNNIAHLLGRREPGAVYIAPMVRALQMLWIGCGIYLSSMSFAMTMADQMRTGLFDSISAGVLGVGFFVSSFLTNVRWLRFVALGWWAGELAFFVVRSAPQALLLGAALMLCLLALPGYLLSRKAASGGCA